MAEKAESVYQIKIDLDRLSPPVWRRVLTPDVSLEWLHFIIQKAMGWGCDHAYEFVVGKQRYVAPEQADRWSGEDAGEVLVSQVARGRGKKLKYLYDFGDSWLHTITVEKVVPRQEGVRYPVCVEGKNRCPPEDVGGVARYQFFVEAINDPKHPGHQVWREWWEGPFDPEEFDLEAVNRQLGQMKVE